jgi:hypothetical protein
MFESRGKSSGLTVWLANTIGAPMPVSPAAVRSASREDAADWSEVAVVVPASGKKGDAE